MKELSDSEPKATCERDQRTPWTWKRAWEAIGVDQELIIESTKEAG